MKHLSILILIVICLSSAYLFYDKGSYHKVFSVDSPVSIYVDLNSNLIRDEKEPFYISDIFFADRNKDYSSDKDFKSVPFEKILIADFYAKQTAENLLHNKFIKIKDNDLIIKNTSYRTELLKFDYFYENTPESKQEFIKYLDNINPDDYIMLNTRRLTYHKLNCKHAKELRYYKIIKKDAVPKEAKPCGACILEKKTENKNNFKTPIPVISVKKPASSIETENITVYFLDLNGRMLPSKNCTTQACLALKNEINSAKESIDFAVYGINKQPDIINALINAKKRGVKIRWVTDNEKKGDSYYPDTEYLKTLLSDYNTDKSYDDKTQGAIMHNKFFIFDGKKVWTGSANITGTDISDFNANLSVLINSEQIANIYTDEFNQMYEGKFHTDKIKNDKHKANINNSVIEVYFSPQDEIITKQIIPLLNNAKNYIYIPVFFITKKELINVLAEAKQRGVDIKIINDATNSHSPSSIHKELRKFGIQVKTENYAGKMHMKSIIIDDEISIIGSMNFSNSGEKRNDENVLIIRNKNISIYLRNIFEYLWAKIPDKYLKYDVRAESVDSIGSCFDGIDNNFDGKIDSEDEGCFIKK